MKRTCRIFLLSFGFSLLASAGIFVLLVTYCGRGYSGDQTWFLDFHPLKRHFAAQKTSPKIILYGGSSSLFGINGEELQRYTGLDNINFSSSVLMPIRLYLVDLEKYMGEGDIVVLPLEPTMHYSEGREKVFSEFGLSCLLGTLPEAKRFLNGAELFSLYAYYGFSWVTKTLFHEDAPLGRLLTGDSRQGVFEGLHSETYVAEQWKRAAAGEIPKAGLQWEMSPYGDWIRDLPAKYHDIGDLVIPTTVTEEFLSTYRQVEELVRRRNGTLLVVVPNQYYYAEQIQLEEFIRSARNAGVRICGRPEATAYPKSFYFEPWHMNRHGARLWTRDLAKTICAETGRPFLGGDEAWPYVIFAENPKSHFPGGGRIERYETGVRVYEKSFLLAVRLPDDLRGRDLDVSIVLKTSVSGNPSISSIRCGETKLEFDEKCFRVRSECQLFIPSNCTQTAVLKLDLAQAAEAIGLERLFVSGAAKSSGEYSVASDKEIIRLGKGFAGMESWGCWTDGETAQFDLVVPARFKGKDLHLTFEAITFVTDGHPVCEFSFESAGERLGDFESRAWDHSFKLDVPVRCVKDDVLPLTIRVKHAVSHAELGKGSDPRRLGVGLKRVRFTLKP